MSEKNGKNFKRNKGKGIKNENEFYDNLTKLDNRRKQELA
jgi:hypothetical protein